VTDAPIGIFDSGFGGLTVARAVLDQLPHEAVLYLGDTARTPYGPRPVAEVRRYALECLDRLVDHGVKALVIACNSASAAMLADARERYDVPVVEVIRPVVRRAAAVTHTGRVGVISTVATHQSRAYVDAFAAAPHITVYSQPCPRFVEFVEAGVTSGPEVIATAREYLEPLLEVGIDTLILGCTHYPLLSSVLSYVLGDGVTLVSSAEATAAELFRVLTDGGLLAPEDGPEPTHQFLTTGDPHDFTPLARRFLGPEVEHVGRAFVGRPEERVGRVEARP
jgi:glutamate racemase